MLIGIIFIDLVVAYKKLTLEKNALEETLKTSLNYEKDDLSETASEVRDVNRLILIALLYLIYCAFPTVYYCRQYSFNLELIASIHLYLITDI